MAWTIEFAKSVRKSIEKLDPQTRRRIRDFLDDKVASLDNPRSLGRALSGPLGGLWRYRVGDYRIICDIKDNMLTILVITIDHRKDVYR